MKSGFNCKLKGKQPSVLIRKIDTKKGIKSTELTVLKFEVWWSQASFGTYDLSTGRLIHICFTTNFLKQTITNKLWIFAFIIVVLFIKTIYKKLIIINNSDKVYLTFFFKLSITNYFSLPLVFLGFV